MTMPYFCATLPTYVFQVPSHSKEPSRCCCLPLVEVNAAAVLLHFQPPPYSLPHFRQSPRSSLCCCRLCLLLQLRLLCPVKAQHCSRPFALPDPSLPLDQAPEAAYMAGACVSFFCLFSLQLKLNTAAILSQSQAPSLLLPQPQKQLMLLPPVSPSSAAPSPSSRSSR